MTTAEAPVTCQVPSGFTPVDLAASPAERAAAVRAGLPADVSDVSDMVARNEEFAQRLLASHACYGAVFVLPPHRPAYFTITEPAVPPDLADLTARLPDGAREIDLPCGPALTCVRQMRADGVAVVEEHVFAVHPAGRMIAFTMGVQDDERRPEDAHLFAEILSTVSFTS